MFDSQGDHQNYWDRRETKLTCKSSRLQTEDVSGLMLEIRWTEAINSFLAVSFAQEPLQRLEDVLSKEVEQRMLNALEEKVDLAIRDLQRCGHLSWGVTRESTVSATPEICNPTRRLYGFGKERCCFFWSLFLGRCCHGPWEAVGDSDQWPHTTGGCSAPEVAANMLQRIWVGCVEMNYGNQIGDDQLPQFVIQVCRVFSWKRPSVPECHSSTEKFVGCNRLTVDLKRELEQRLVDANSKTQHTLADLRQEWDARAAQVPRHGQHATYPVWSSEGIFIALTPLLLVQESRISGM